MVATLARDGYARFGDVATMHADGTHFNQLTHSGYNTDLIFSPDHQFIAYRSVPDSISPLPDPRDNWYTGPFDIWVITADGSRASPLTDSQVPRSKPAWSPDSKKVAFVESRSNLVEINMQNVDRREIANDATIPIVYEWNAGPRYRPDGNGIGYITSGGGLAWIDNAGSIVTLVPTATLPISTTVMDFDWLPDGQHVVYILVDKTKQRWGNLGTRYSVWIVRADGSFPVRLTIPNDYKEGLHSIQVSPDGRIISALAGSGYGDVCSVDLWTVFLLLASDRASAQIINFQDFDRQPLMETPAPSEDFPKMFFPTSDVTWISSRLVFATYDVTCATNPMEKGIYLIDPIARRMVQITH
jgi:Tol biopolymer transport system component